MTLPEPDQKGQAGVATGVSLAGTGTHILPRAKKSRNKGYRNRQVQRWEELGILA